MKHFFLTIILLCGLTNINTAQTFERSIALLNLTQRNAESNSSRLFSAEQMLKVAGIPFEILTDPNEAVNHSLILCSSQLISNSFTSLEKTALANYVSDGGVLLAPRVLDDDFFALFGISGYSDSKTNYSLTWANTLSSTLSRWINEPEEWTISLGDETGGNIFKSYAYELTSAVGLAHYQNATTAITQNEYGDGFAYAFGISWKELILRNQINRDYDAQRITSNGFEPTQDVLMLFIRAIFCEHVPYTTWKHTSPAKSTSTLMISHDIDSSSGVDSMPDFAQSERAMGIQATYNVTLRYFSDALNNPFYIGSETSIAKVLNDGHVLGSHSVGHFPDFADTGVFPMGDTGYTMANYTPHNNGTLTTGGNVFAECEISKNVLEEDHNVAIKSFRAGHLAYNPYLVNVLDSLGYLYNSSYSASDVLTHFPYQNVKNRSFSGDRSRVYELPVTISDVFHDEPISIDNYLEKADIWLEVLSKNDKNNGTTVLLIHPNRGYKLLGQEYFLSQVPESVCIEEMTAFGDYWKEREAFDYETEIIGNSLFITFTNDALSLDKNISLIINDGQNLNTIITQDENGNPTEFLIEDWENEDIIIYRNDGIISALDTKEEAPASIKLFPNPIKKELNIEIDLKSAATIQVEVLDLFGNRLLNPTVNKFEAGPQSISVPIPSANFTNGIYFCKIDAGINGTYLRTIIFND